MQFTGPTGYASGSQAPGGIGVTCSVSFNNFLLTVVGGKIVSFVVTMTSSADGQGGSSLNVDSRNYTVTVDGTLLYNNNIQSVTYQSPVLTSISIINITQSISVHGNDGIYRASASLNNSYDVSAIASSSDFIFVGTNVGNTKVVLLPDPATCTGKMFIIKDKTNAAQSRNIIITPSNGVAIDNVPTSPVIISANSGCLSLFSNGTGYFIANNYPSNNQSFLQLQNFPTSGVSVNASINAINIFNTTQVNGRYSGVNKVVLPSSTGTIGICIIVYSGDNTVGSRLSSNPLILQAPSGGSIDCNSTLGPYLYVDDPKKSCGIVLINDGSNNWYVVGYYNSSGWDWISTTNGGGTQLSASDKLDIKLINPNANAFYSLPFGPSLPYTPIIKTQSIQSGGSGVRYCTFMQGQAPVLQFFNNTSPGIFWTGNQTNNCLWIIAASKSGPSNPIVLYYPVIGYTP